MSVTKHYTEWSKEDKDALASERMEAMMKKNEEIRRRYAEVEEDRKKAEQQNSSVTLAIKAKSPPADDKFLDESRTWGSGYEDSHDVSRRNCYNLGSKDFRNSRQGAAQRRPHEKESDRGSHMSERERDDYVKWKAERQKIDEERIARHKVKREWDEHKVEQEPEHKPLLSKFYREPNWSKQDDWPQRRDFNQRGHYRGNDRAHFKNPRHNYESEDANWHDKPNKSFGRSGTKDSSFDKFGRASLSDDEDNRYSNRQWKFDSSNNYPGFRKNQDGTSSQSFRGRGRGFSQGSRNDYGKTNSTSLSNQHNSFSKNVSNTDSNPVRISRVFNSSDNCFDRRNDGQDANSKGRFRGNDDTHAKSRGPKQSSGTWSDDEGTGLKSATMTVQKSGSSRTKQQSSGNWSDDEGTGLKSATMTVQKSGSSRTKQSSGNWSDDDDSICHKTNDHPHSVKRGDSFSRKKQSSGDAWSSEDTSSNISTALSKNKSGQSSGTWSDDDNYVNSKSSAKTSAHRNNSSVPKFRKKPSGDTWSDQDDDNCVRIKANSQPKDNLVAPQTKQALGTWSDDDGTDVKRHSKSSSSTGSKDRVSSGGAWSDIDDESLACKSRNDDAWLDISDKNEDSSSKYGKSRKWTGKQPPVNYPAGRGRKWSFEPSREYSSEAKNSSCIDRDEQKSENRAISLGAGDNWTVTISGASNDVKGKRPFSQWGVRNSEPYYKNTQVLNRSMSDPDKHQVIHDEPNHVRRYNNEHGFQQNSRNFRGRGSSLKRGNFSNIGLQKNNFEDYPQQKFRDSSRGGARGSRGGFQHNNNFNRGARRVGETRRYTENHVTQNRSSKSQRSERPDDDGWGDIGKENLAVSVHSEDIWGDAEGSKNANLSADWIDNNSSTSQCLKSEGKTEDGWETENCDGSSLQPNDNDWKSKDFTNNQIKQENKMYDCKSSEGMEQRNLDAGRPHENIDTGAKNNIHESPLRECTGNESHDDSSWVTTSGDEFDEELAGGEYIDDDESLHVSGVQRYECGGDTSSPEPSPDFVCSLGEYLKLRAASACKDQTETKQVHGTEKSEGVEEKTFCTTPKLGNSAMTENILLPEENELSADNNSDEVLPVPESQLNSVTENCPSTVGGDQKFLPKDCVEESLDTQVSAVNDCKNAECLFLDSDNQKAMKISPEQLAVSNPIPADGSCKALNSGEYDLSHSESSHEKNDKLEGSNLNISDHSKNGDLSLCSEALGNSSSANKIPDLTSAEELHQNCISVNSPKSIYSETTSSGNSEYIKTSEDLGENNEFQNSTAHNVDKETNNVCITFSDSASCDDNCSRTVMSPEENNSSELMYDKQEDRSESEISNFIISSSELGVGDKTEVGIETAFTIQQTDVSTANNEMPMPSEDLDFSKSVPAEDSDVTSDPREKNM